MENEKHEPRKLFPELRAWLDETETRQFDVARLLGMSAPYFSQCLSGVRRWSTDQAVTLATTTGIPVEKLLSDRGAIRLAKLLGKQSNRPSKKPNDNDKVA